MALKPFETAAQMEARHKREAVPCASCGRPRHDHIGPHPVARGLCAGFVAPGDAQEVCPKGTLDALRALLAVAYCDNRGRKLLLNAPAFEAARAILDAAGKET